MQGDSTYHFVHPEVTSDATEHVCRHTVHLVFRFKEVDHVAHSSARRFPDIGVDACRAVVFFVVVIGAHSVEMWRLRVGSIFPHRQPYGYLHGRFNSRP